MRMKRIWSRKPLGFLEKNEIRNISGDKKFRFEQKALLETVPKKSEKMAFG